MNTFEQMIDRGHERACFHHDPQTGLRAIVAVHSTKLGNALGGTRRWNYATEADALYDVLRLSDGTRTVDEITAAICGTDPALNTTDVRNAVLGTLQGRTRESPTAAKT